MATHYHSVEHHRPRTRGPFIYRSESSLYFVPNETRWANSTMRHQVSSLAAHGNPLAKIAERASAIGLDLVSWTLCCHSSWLGRKYPTCAEQNALGNRYPEALCPANPMVRQFLQALANDLSHNYRISLLELESFHYAGCGHHYHQHEKIGIPYGALGHFLLGICFCEHCVSRGANAGIDVESLRAKFAKAIREMLEAGTGPKGTVEQFVNQTSDTSRYLDTRAEVVSSLVREIKAASAVPLSPIVWSDRVSGGVDGAKIANITGSITVAAYHSDAADTRRTIAHAINMAGDPDRVRVGYHIYPPVTPDCVTLMRNVEASLELGVRAFSFYHYGVAPGRCLDWVREAADLIHNHIAS